MTPRERRLAKKERDEAAWKARCARRLERLKATYARWRRPHPKDEEGVFHVPMPTSFGIEHGFSFAGVSEASDG